MFNTNPETAIEVDAVSNMLTQLPMTEILSYASIGEALGYDCQRKPFSVFKARKKAEAETGLRFETVRGVGIRKIDSAAVVGIGAAARRRIARHAKYQAIRLTGLKYNDIAPEIRSRIDAERSLLGAISATARASTENIASHTSTGPVVPARVFEMIKS